MDKHGYTCVYMDIHGNTWIYMEIHGYTERYMGIDGYTCLLNSQPRIMHFACSDWFIISV